MNFARKLVWRCRLKSLLIGGFGGQCNYLITQLFRQDYDSLGNGGIAPTIERCTVGKTPSLEPLGTSKNRIDFWKPLQALETQTAHIILKRGQAE